MKITSKLLCDTTLDPKTIAEIRRLERIPEDRRIITPVFESIYRGKVIYCCVSRGVMREGDAGLTLVGRAALEGLMSIPVEQEHPVVLRPISGERALVGAKIKEVFARVPAFSKVCFIDTVWYPGQPFLDALNITQRKHLLH